MQARVNPTFTINTKINLNLLVKSLLQISSEAQAELTAYRFLKSEINITSLLNVKSISYNFIHANINLTSNINANLNRTNSLNVLLNPITQIIANLGINRFLQSETNGQSIIDVRLTQATNLITVVNDTSSISVVLGGGKVFFNAEILAISGSEVNIGLIIDMNALIIENAAILATLNFLILAIYLKGNFIDVIKIGGNF
jgi:hypothetical protein